MSVGLGLPFGDLALLTAWARRADASPFTSLALPAPPHSRQLPLHAPLFTLAALVGATARIRLRAELPLPAPGRAAPLARQSAALAARFGDRCALAVGDGTDGSEGCADGGDGRSCTLDARLAALWRAWSTGPYGASYGPRRPGGAPVPVFSGAAPAPAVPLPGAPVAVRHRPPLLLGCSGPAVAERVARWADGVLCGPLPYQHLDGLFRDVEAAWYRAGRAGRPLLATRVPVALGPRPVLDRARRALRVHHPSPGDADRAAAGLLTTRAQLRDTVAAHLALGADEVTLTCWAPDPGQLEPLADALFPEDGDWPGFDHRPISEPRPDFDHRPAFDHRPSPDHRPDSD